MVDIPTLSLRVKGISEDLPSSELQRPNGALLCVKGASIARDNPFQLQESVNSKTYYYRLTLSHGPSLFHSFRVKVSGSAESVLALYFSGEEDALSFTVRGGDGLQLQEIQQHLDLQGNRKQKKDR